MSLIKDASDLELSPALDDKDVFISNYYHYLVHMTMQKNKRALVFGMVGAIFGLCLATMLVLVSPHSLRSAAFLPIIILCRGGLDCVQSLSEYDLLISSSVTVIGCFLSGMFLAILTKD